MEVSSHALDLDRVYGSDFDIAVFSNLSQDHMDYHKNFENYFEAKKKLFAMCEKALINIDDGLTNEPIAHSGWLRGIGFDFQDVFLPFVGGRGVSYDDAIKCGYCKNEIDKIVNLKNSIFFTYEDAKKGCDYLIKQVEQKTK